MPLVISTHLRTLSLDNSIRRNEAGTRANLGTIRTRIATVANSASVSGRAAVQHTEAPSEQLPNSSHQVARRQMLLRTAAVCSGLTGFNMLAPQASKAEGEEAAVAADPFEGAFVKPALPLVNYLQEINTYRAPAFASMYEDIQDGNLTHLSNSLFIAPFDNVRQGMFFAPWVVLKDSGEKAGTEVMIAYLAFRDQLLRVDSLAIEAAYLRADDEEVENAVRALDKTIDVFLSKIPA